MEVLGIEEEGIRSERCADARFKSMLCIQCRKLEINFGPQRLCVLQHIQALQAWLVK